MNRTEIKGILTKHELWLKGEYGGERANLQGADLQRANLQRADLQRADLQGANLDFSCLPLWCGSKSIKVDSKIASQIAAHFCALDCDDPDYQNARESILEFARTSHIAVDLGLKLGGKVNG